MRNGSLGCSALLLLLLLLFSVQPLAAEMDYYSRGVTLFQEGEYEEALTYLKEALQRDESDYLHYLIGLSYLNLEKGELAKESIEKSLELNPSFYLGYINLARAKILLEEYPEGLAALEEATLLEAKDYSVYHLKGRIYLNMANWERAKESFLKAKELAPNNIYVLNNLGLSYIYLGLYSSAKDVLEEAIEKDPPLPYIYNNMGVVYERLGLKEEALASYREALNLDPDHYQALLNYRRLQEEN